MRSALILFFFIFLIGCKDGRQEPMLICTEQYVTISVTVSNSQESPVALDSFKVSRLADQADVTIKVSPADYAIMQKQGTYPIASDGFKPLLQDKKIELHFTGMIGGKVVVNEKYIVGSDGCHIVLVSGEKKVIVSE